METVGIVGEVRQRTRAAQHVTSFPLLVLGVLFINYGITGFASQPVQWRYAGALAFVLLWGLGKANEYATGVGPARSDYLAIACGVFVATQVTFVTQILTAKWATEWRIQALWIGIVGLGLLAAGVSGRAPALFAWGVVICGTAVVIGALGYQLWVYKSALGFSFQLPRTVPYFNQNEVVIGLGILLTVAGSIAFVGERRRT